jgi:hypothetical protein
MSWDYRGRQAVASTDYEEKLKDLPKLTKQAKAKRLEAILADKQNGCTASARV